MVRVCFSLKLVVLVARLVFLHFFLACLVWTKWSSTLSPSGWQTSGRISCQAFWEVSAPCTLLSSCVSSYCRFLLQHPLLHSCQMNNLIVVNLCLSVGFSSPWSARSLLAAHWAVQKGWAHYPRSPAGGSIIRHLHSISGSGAQQQAGAGHTGTPSVLDSHCKCCFRYWDTSSDVCLLVLQATAETVYDILSPTPPLNRFTITEGRAPSSRPRRAAQPADLREGVAKAYDTVREVRSQTSSLFCFHYCSVNFLL